MTRALALSLVLFTLPAQAEITKLGDWAVGQPSRKQSFLKSVTALGCTGSLRQGGDKGKVTEVVFSPDSKCDKKALDAAIEKEYGAKPIWSTDKTARLWEGKTGSVLLKVGMSGDTTVKLGPPGAGAKRGCFADDGFPAFFKTFKGALDKPDAVAATFKFPIKDFEGKVVAKDARALVKKWPKLVEADDKSEIASGKLVPTCDVGDETYNLRLSNSNVSFEAKRTGDVWQWHQINSEASG